MPKYVHLNLTPQVDPDQFRKIVDKVAVADSCGTIPGFQKITCNCVSPCPHSS